MGNFGRDFLQGFQVGTDIGSKLRDQLVQRAKIKQANEVNAQVNQRVKELSAGPAAAKAKMDALEARVLSGEGEPVDPKELTAARVMWASETMQASYEIQGIYAEAITAHPDNELIGRTLGARAAALDRQNAGLFRQLEMEQNKINRAEDREMRAAERAEDKEMRAAERAEDKKFQRESREDVQAERRGERAIDRAREDKRWAAEDDRWERTFGLRENEDRRADRQLTLAEERAQREADEKDYNKAMRTISIGLASGWTIDDIAEKAAKAGMNMPPELISLMADKYEGISANRQQEMKRLDSLVKQLDRKEEETGELSGREIEMRQKFKRELEVNRNVDREEAAESIRVSEIMREDGFDGVFARHMLKLEPKMESTFRFFGLPVGPEGVARYEANRAMSSAREAQESR